MEVKHTKGPCYIHCHKDGCDIHTYHEVNGQTMHFIIGNTVIHEAINPEVCVANATLWAAAPELLEALKELLEEYVGEMESSPEEEARFAKEGLDIESDGTVKKARAAFAKATPPSAPAGEDKAV